MKKLALASALVASLFAVNAQAYQTEVGASIGIVDPDKADNAVNFGVDGTLYFNNVKVGNSPLNEAAFLSRASNVAIDLNHADNDGVTKTSINGGVEYFVPNSNFYLSGAIEHDRTKVENTNGTDKYNTYTGEVGYLPIPGLLVTAGVAYLDNESSNTTNDSETSPLLRAKYVTNVGGFDMNFEGRAIFGDDAKRYNLGTDFYIDKTFSVGASYEGFDGDNTNDDDRFGIHAKKFFNPQLSLEGNVGFADEANEYGVRLGYRF